VVLLRGGRILADKRDIVARPVLSIGIGANTHGDQLSVPVAPALSAADIHLWLVAAVGCGN
jgi:hypothetical protein